MITVGFKPVFLRQFKKLQQKLQDEIVFKVELLKSEDNHEVLSVHKLKGRLKNQYSFSVNYKYRIIFEKDTAETYSLLSVGDHDIYN